MAKQFIRRFIQTAIIGLFLALAVGCKPKAHDDCGFIQNVYGQRISWKNKYPVTVHIHTSVPKTLRPSIYRAANTWESIIGRKVFEINEDSSGLSTEPTRDGKNAIYFLSNWESDRSSEQGRTSVLWAGDEIQEADIRLNHYDFSFYDISPEQLVPSIKSQSLPFAVSRDGYSFEALMLHEMGHFLGLKHRENDVKNQGTVMATRLAAFSDRVTPASSDRSSIQCEY